MKGKRRIPVVLVVEDQPQLLSLLEEFVSGLGFEVLTAPSGTQAAQTAADVNGDIGLLITDIEMPGLDGIALAKILKSNRPDLAIIYLSGALKEMNNQDAAFVKGSICMEKPVSFTKLQSSIVALLPSQTAELCSAAVPVIGARALSDV